MNNKSRIKVIKREQFELQSAIPKSNKKIASTKSAARDVVATVTGWIDEFQQKRSEETKKALKMFFLETPQAKGCTNC
jgi:hypothetical protein